MHSELCERLSELGERLCVGTEFIEFYGWMHLFRILLNFNIFSTTCGIAVNFSCQIWAWHKADLEIVSNCSVRDAPN